MDIALSFRERLITAITLGREPRSGAGLGPATLAAIRLIAHEHPDAPIELIIDAYDAFQREHG